MIQVQAVNLRMKMPKDYNIYNWPFIGEPVHNTDGSILLTPVEEIVSPGNRHDETYYRGKPLLAKIDFLDEFKSNIAYLEILSGEIKKTLVSLRIEPSLSNGEKGWLRLIVKPSHRKSETSKTKRVPCMPYPIGFFEKKVTTCPLIVQASIKLELKELYEKTKKPIIRNACLHLKDLLLEKFEQRGTSVRVNDHRIALVSASEEMDIHEISSTPGMDFFGEIDFNGDTNNTALIWGGGSCRNIHDDLMHNARRIIDKIENSELKSFPTVELVRELAHPEKNEAFWFLVEQMKEVKLLEEHEGLLKLKRDDLDASMESRFSDLREKYFLGNVPEKKIGLLKEFKELHAFTINYRISWNNTSNEIKRWWGHNRKI